MSSRREALLERFRARSLERVRRICLSLLELEQGRWAEEGLRALARDLHTLKGDSTVVGQEQLAALAHATEELLKAKSGEPPSPADAAQARMALEVAEAVLREERQGEAADQALITARLALLAKVAALPGEQAAPSPVAEAKAPVASPAPVAASAPVASPSPAPASAQGGGPLQPPAQEPAPAQPSRSSVRWVQVPAGRIDGLCETVMDLAAEFRALSTELAPVLRQEEGTRARTLLELVERSRRRLEDAIDSAWSLRLVPVEPACEELVRHAHELAKKSGKQLRVTVRAEGAEVERSVLDELWEPLLHLVRNAIDHGIEEPAQRQGKPAEGTLAIQARSVGPNLSVSVSDDGRGIDPKVVREAAVARGLLTAEAAAGQSEQELLMLLFRHGFSTRAQVSETSGRGVGLDVVQSRTDALGGTIRVENRAGKGARFEIIVPASLSKERTLVVECGGALYGLPAFAVSEVVELNPADVETLVGGQALKYRGESLPFRSLGASLGYRESAADRWALIIDSGKLRGAFGVSQLLGEHEVLRRPMDPVLAPFIHLAASALLEDGRLVLLLSTSGMFRRAELGGVQVRISAPAERRRRVLLVDDSPTVRDLLCEILLEAGLEVDQAQDGRAAMARMDTHPPDLVLSDLEMPLMDGFELLEQIRGRWQYLPVVLFTTRGSAEDRRRATSLGADAYLVKSDFQEGTLIETVRRFLNRL